MHTNNSSKNPSKQSLVSKPNNSNTKSKSSLHMCQFWADLKLIKGVNMKLQSRIRYMRHILKLEGGAASEAGPPPVSIYDWCVLFDLGFV